MNDPCNQPTFILSIEIFGLKSFRKPVLPALNNPGMSNFSFLMLKWLIYLLIMLIPHLDPLALCARNYVLCRYFWWY